tara:strand:+ start:4573 stop:4899 length:327 start_codon:yes stop_codon:yes gene_type:complete
MKSLFENWRRLNETGWDVSKRTAFPRVLSQILSALREAQGIIDGGHLDSEQPVSESDIERIKEIFNHPVVSELKKLGGVIDEITMEDAYGTNLDFMGAVSEEDDETII